MIKVINDTPHPSVVKQIVCRNCGVTLEYTPNDVMERIDRDYGGGSELFRYIPCPKCNHKQGMR